mgnify:CR=1 FL=1
MVSVDQVYMIGHMKNADGSINNKNVVLSAACEAAELFQCMMAVNQKTGGLAEIQSHLGDAS